MKKLLLYFVIAFLLGFFGFATINKKTPEISSTSSATTARDSSSNRVNDSFTEYEALMLEDEEKFTLLIDQANDLNSLLGLAEKFWGEYGDSNMIEEVQQKLAKLYPAQALRYYATFPSNAEMNQRMSGAITRKWSFIDLTAYLSYIDRDENLSLYDFCRAWEESARTNLPEKSTECAEAFAKLSRKKQLALIDNLYSGSNVAAALLPAVTDPAMLADLQKKVDEQKKSSQAINVPDPEATKEEERIAALIEQCKTVKPEPQQLSHILDAEKDENVRRKILDAALAPLAGEEDNVTLWLKRISETLAVVNQLPDYPPNARVTSKYLNQKVPFIHQKELESWLPTQSPSLQRAWADDITESKAPEEAIAWIEKLSTAALRSDMREHVIQTWTDSDPREAAHYIVTKSTTEEQEDLIPQAVYAWALNDFASARKWLEAQTDSPAKTAALKKLEK